MKTAIYAGSFDPFTNGHLDVVRRAAALFDRVIVLIAVNPFKTRIYDPAIIANAICDIFEGDDYKNCEVMVAGPDEWTVDIAAAEGAQYLIRGLRNETDYLTEEELATANKKLNSNIETIYFRSNFEDISSTKVKEYAKYEKELIKSLVPSEIYKIIEER